MVPKPREELQKYATKERYRYYLGQYNTEVCRHTFIDTLNISPGRLKSINKRRNTTNGEIKPDQRGKRE